VGTSGFVVDRGRVETFGADDIGKTVLEPVTAMTAQSGKQGVRQRFDQGLKVQVHIAGKLLTHHS
jgi:hypothetical protein